MPRCEGRPDGPCPEKKNDASVHGTQGDLMLCDDCEQHRFPYVKPRNRKTKEKSSKEKSSTSSMELSADAQKATQQIHVHLPQDDPAASSMSHMSVHDVHDVKGTQYMAHRLNAESVAGNDPSSATTAGLDIHGATATPSMVCSNLLMYVNCFRDRAEAGNVKKVLGQFYTSNEIADAKQHLMMISTDVMKSEFATERRSSAQRSASEAEIDDIVGLFDILDRSGHLNDVKFAACNYDRLPSYGPEDINECAIADRQSRLEAAIATMSANIDLLALNQPAVCDTTHFVEMFDKKLTESTQMIQDQLSQLAATCAQIMVSSSSSGGPTPSDGRTHPVDRTRNIVISGIAEDRNSSVWRSKVADALFAAAGHHIQILDAFRIGGRFDQRKTRPILVKLQSAWDRRVVLSGAHNLSNDARFVRVFLSADEPLDVRRRNQLDRLKKRALRDGKRAVVNDGVLLIDDVIVFSLECGFVRESARDDGGNVSSPVTNG